MPISFFRGLTRLIPVFLPLTALAQAPVPAALPILQANCQPCHSSALKSSGLSVASRESMLEGGNRGPALKPGDPAASTLVQAVEQTGDLKMPPGRKLPPEQLATIREWVKTGAAWPASAATSTSAKPKGFDWWAFQPVKRADPPTVADARWSANPIDRFIYARLAKEKLKPAPEASKETLIRRVSLDLTGLLPSPAEVREFAADTRPDAYEQLVDRLLASHNYGERWGRHWLDVARYADSDGYTIDAPRQIWKYRDWVLKAINSDMPFSQFVVDQIAGDMAPNPTTDQLVATGFHRNTPSNFEGGVDFEQYRVEAVVDRVSTTGSAFMGLTVGCARCHDHKFDPLTQKEFYQLFAFFNNTDEITTEAERYDFNRPILEVPSPEEIARRKAFNSQFGSLSRELITYVRELAAKGVKDTANDPELQERVQNLRELRRREPKFTTTLVMRELPKPRDAYIQLGGDFMRKGIPVQPAVPAFLPPLPAGATTRLDFAKWLVDPANPLTARVTVNRFWQEYFGKGLVETENDFGAQGNKPSHPELLDYLASEFMARNWSQKAIHRLIVTSATYKQSSKERPELEEVDPYNKLLARQNRLRLDAEIIRDAALSASGLLTDKVGGPSVYTPIPEGAMSVTQVAGAWPTATGPDRYRRGLYTFFRRSAAFPGLLVFDAPDATSACTRRVRSNTPLQALTTLNDEAFLEFAEGLAARILKEAPADNKERIRYGFQLALGRNPRTDELERLERHLARMTDEYKSHPSKATELIYKGGKFTPEGVPANPPPPKLAAMLPSDLQLEAAWTGVARVLLNLDDFLTRN